MSTTKYFAIDGSDARSVKISTPFDDVPDEAFPVPVGGTEITEKQHDARLALIEEQDARAEAEAENRIAKAASDRDKALAEEAAVVFKESADLGFSERAAIAQAKACLLYTSPSPRDQRGSRMPSSA